MTAATQTKGTGEIHPEQVEELDGINVLRGGGSQRGWNGIQYQQGLSGKNAGAQNLSINVATVLNKRKPYVPGWLQQEFH